jgi:hypothetical protein
MSEIIDVFAYDVTSAVYAAGSIVALITYGVAAAWIFRMPIMETEFSPSFGM